MRLTVYCRGMYDFERDVAPGIDDAYIRQCLAELYEEFGEERFVILADHNKEPGNEEYYIQVAYTPWDDDDDEEEDDDGEEEGFLVGSQNGSSEEDFEDEDDDEDYDEDYDEDDDDEDNDEDDGEEERFILQYRDGSGDKHYSCLDDLTGDVGLELVTRIFIDYLHSREDWKASFAWERENL